MINGYNYQSNSNICFDCEKACGGCSWTAVDPKTNKIRFEPVPGWEAEAVTVGMGQGGNGKRRVATYRITDCPLFEPSRKR